MADNRFHYNNEDDPYFISYKKTYGTNMNAHHYHNSYEVYYLKTGERNLFIKDRVIELKTGDFLIIKPNILHMTRNGKLPEYERIILNYRDDFIDKDKKYQQDLSNLFQQDYMVIHLPLQDRILIEDILNHMILEVDSQLHGYETQIKSLILHLLVTISRSAENNNIKEMNHINSTHEKISDVVKYINQHYYQVITLERLSNCFFISPYYLSRTFKEVTGLNIIEYLNTIRIKEAKRLLRETNYKISLIAEKVGFGSLSNFGRVFKEGTGHSPRYYRTNKNS
ncbi:AraC-like DNA-binding protein [Natranaerovirga hydrolytica]|uniref:AraC-like DNA-binding protein n=1 Tax=Natranaerovirga hydrolytica TaxID=680378 RepID=A0A4V2Q1L6_9FIRM|nr:AraC family transcriptional regulator [Natranaerovirga hydrolytica]TCK98121.1 AraC-like DNA-binding protein [Natranaerovirga hydrolytica]